MSWKVRHQGSPQFVEVDSAEEIGEGIQDGLWEPTDEVMAPGERRWTELEQHPAFEEALADYDPLPSAPPPEETRLDMNPLIDVSLVLLIFFIITTVYEELRKEFPPPPAMPEEAQKTGQISENELKKFTIRVTALMEDGQPVLRVENVPVPERDLQDAIEKAMQKTGYSRLAVEVQPAVPWRTFMAIQDAAAGAKIQETIRIQRAPRGEVEER